MNWIQKILARFDRTLYYMDFPGGLVEEIAVTGAQSDIAITGGDVVVAGLPTGAVIERAFVGFLFRMVENTYAGANALDAAAALPMQLDDSANTGWVDCIDFANNAFTLAASTREGGTVIFGDIDVSARVDGNDTYDFRWHNAKADQNNLQFNDCQLVIRIWYSV